MLGKACIIGLALLAGVVNARAQTVTTTDGAAGYVPVFSGTTSIDPSVMTYTSGWRDSWGEQVYTNASLGINTTDPGAGLNLVGRVFISSLTTYRADAALHIFGGQGSYNRLTEFDGTPWQTGVASNIMSSTDANGAPHYWSWGLYNNQWFMGAGDPHFTISSAGNVGIGTDTPNAALELAIPNGHMLLSSSNATLTFPDGTVQQTAWNNSVLGGDYAESVQLAGKKAEYSPGDIVVLDAAYEGHFAKSQHPYSKLVAGVISTKPGLVGKRMSIANAPTQDQLPLALIGIVPIKVSSENGPIEPGDLLVSASRPGFAMKGTDQSRLRGAVLGKALASLPSGEGTIEALIMVR